MDKKIRAAIIIIAKLPTTERDEALQLADVTGEVYNFISSACGLVKMADCDAYRRSAAKVGGVDVLRGILTEMSVEFSGGTGGRGNPLVAELKKIPTEKGDNLTLN